MAEKDNNFCEIINVIKLPGENIIEFPGYESAYKKKFNKAVKLFNKYVQHWKDMPLYPVLLLYGEVYPMIAESYM